MTKSTSEGSGYLLHRAAQQLSNWKRPPSPPIEPDLEADLDELERTLDAALAFLREIRRGSLRIHNPDPERQPRLIGLKKAGLVAGKHRDTIRKWAQEYGFGWRLDNGEWVVDQDALEAHLRGFKTKVG